MSLCHAGQGRSCVVWLQSRPGALPAHIPHRLCHFLRHPTAARHCAVWPDSTHPLPQVLHQFIIDHFKSWGLCDNVIWMQLWVITGNLSYKLIESFRGSGIYPGEGLNCESLECHNGQIQWMWDWHTYYKSTQVLFCYLNFILLILFSW